MLKRMNSKSIQNTWCYREKLLSLWISSIDILGFFYIHCILKMCLKNTLVQGWGGGKAKAYFWVQGWVGVQKWSFWSVRTLWMAPWMDKDLTLLWCNEVIGSFSFHRRLLAWDTYECHLMDVVKECLTKKRVDQVFQNKSYMIWSRGLRQVKISQNMSNMMKLNVKNFGSRKKFSFGQI